MTAGATGIGEITRLAQVIVGESGSDADEVLLARRVLAECGIGPFRAAVYPTAGGGSCEPLWVSGPFGDCTKAMTEACVYLADTGPEVIAIEGVPGARGVVKKVVENGVHIANIILEPDGAGYAEQTAALHRRVDQLCAGFAAGNESSDEKQNGATAKEFNDGQS